MKTTPLFLLGAASLLVLSSCNKDSSADAPNSGANDLGTGTVGGVALTTDIPKEVIEGSPRPKSKVALMPELKKFPTFLVPEGTVLLSKGKTVTSSDDFPILGDLTFVTDGDKEAGEGYFLELLEGTQWVQIDLAQSNPLYAVILWHFHGQKRVYNDVIVQVSDDPEFKTGVTTLFNNDYDDSSGLGKGGDLGYVESRFGLLLNGKGTKGRYVRCYSKGNSSNEMNHYIEVEVFGKPE